MLIFSLMSIQDDISHLHQKYLLHNPCLQTHQKYLYLIFQKYLLECLIYLCVTFPLQILQLPFQQLNLSENQLLELMILLLREKIFFDQHIFFEENFQMYKPYLSYPRLIVSHLLKNLVDYH